MQKAAASKNVANAVERAARMGPHIEGGGGGGRARLVKNASSGKRSGKGKYFHSFIYTFYAFIKTLSVS